MRQQFIITIVSVLCISIIEIYALSKGIDGKVLTASVSAITFVLGYYFKDLRERLKEKTKRNSILEGGYYGY